MPETPVDIIAQVVDQRLAAILDELKAMSQKLDAVKAASLLEIKTIEARQAAVENASRSISTIPPGSLMSGRWPRRDGDGYANVKPVPALPEPDSANSTPGNLRSTNVS
jgi:hypothetical protein